MNATQSPNTVAAYAYCWRVFARWCETAGRPTLPVAGDTLELFIAWAVAKPYRIETIKMVLSAVVDRHKAQALPSPLTPAVRRLMTNAARQLKEESGAKAALNPEQLRRISKRLGETPIDIRDRAMLLLAFSGGFRRGEVAALRLNDLRVEDRGLRIRIRHSKNDQKGEGREVGIPPGRRASTCPVRQLKRWLNLRGNWNGPLFSCVRGGTIRRERIGGRVVAERLKRALERLGEDASAYAGHSLRAGFVTTGVENGASVLAIMQRTGHKSIEMVQRYVRKGQVFAADPLAGVL